MVPWVKTRKKSIIKVGLEIAYLGDTAKNRFFFVSRVIEAVNGLSESYLLIYLT